MGRSKKKKKKQVFTFFAMITITILSFLRPKVNFSSTRQQSCPFLIYRSICRDENKNCGPLPSYLFFPNSKIYDGKGGEKKSVAMFICKSGNIYWEMEGGITILHFSRD